VKQVVQNYRTGVLSVLDIPAPAVPPRGLAVRNRASVLSVGTEKLMMDLARKSLLGKARARPDLVKQVVDKVRTEGIRETYRTAMSRLDSLTPLGYSCAGVVEQVSGSPGGIAAGDSVACYGSGYASHAEFVAVPRNLCVKTPPGMPHTHAAFAGVGAIALHAVRLGRPGLGSNVLVIGLGLLGQLAVQILRSAGCRVFGVDLARSRCSLAAEHGAVDAAAPPAQDLREHLLAVSDGAGADIVYVLASTPSRDPIELAADLAARGGRIVAPGMVSLDLPRRAFYDKQLELVVSRSAGPGIYDPAYELGGTDYPREHVRWTAQRNMGHFLDMVSSGQVDVGALITHSFPIERAGEAYALVDQAYSPALGVVLDYPEAPPVTSRVELRAPSRRGTSRDVLQVGVIGAGLWARNTLLPVIKGLGNVELRYLATATGTSAVHSGRKYGFESVTTDYRDVLNDPDIDAVVIATRHDTHAAMTAEALRFGKHVFVEKPPALTPDELGELLAAQEESTAWFMAGFNRRFAPLAAQMKDVLGKQGPFSITCRVNAGPVPADSWVHDPERGGGRIVGEVCHFVDLLQFLAGARAVRVYAEGFKTDSPGIDNVVVSLAFENESIGSIVYGATGDKAFPRERIEVIGGGAACVIDDFRSLVSSRSGKRKSTRRRGVDRGHRAELTAFFDSVRDGGGPPAPIEQTVSTMLATFAIEESLRTRQPVEVAEATVCGEQG